MVYLSELLTIDIGHIMIPNSMMALAMNFLRSRETIALTTVPLKPENQMSSHVLEEYFFFQKREVPRLGSTKQLCNTL